MSRPRPRSDAFCVMGMHRCGTSLAAQMLELLGISFGDASQLMEPGPDNQTGYWENRAIKELDDLLLARLGGSWDQPPVLPPGWESDHHLDDLRERARETLDAAFGADDDRPDRYAFKDPRLSLLLPFWRTVVPVAKTVILVRDPFEVAASLETRNKMSEPQSCLLWLRYLLSAIDSDDHALVVRYADFFTDLPGTLHAMADHVGAPRAGPDAIATARSNFDAELRHHRGRRRIGPSSALAALADAVWNDGAIDPDAIDEHSARAIAEGWLRPPEDSEALDRARARVVELTEKLRQRGRARRAAMDSARTTTE